jgi:hypothetical protein
MADLSKPQDYQLLFNSAWPSITVAFQKIIPNVTAFSTVTVNHNLGFPPFIRCWIITAGVCTGTNFTDFSFDSTTVSVTNNDTVDHNYIIVCYNVNLLNDATYKLLKPPASSRPYSPNYGLKVLKPGKDAKSKDLRDYVLHTRAQSPALLAVATQTRAVLNGSQYDLKYTNTEGYTAWIYGFYLSASGSKWVAATLYGQSLPSLFVDNTSTFRLTYPNVNDKATLVVLRDPLFAANSIQASY